MLLALTFGLFLAAPLVLLAASVGRTALGVSPSPEAAVSASASVPGNATAGVTMAAPRRPTATMAPAPSPSGHRSRGGRTSDRPRDFFGDSMTRERPAVATLSPAMSAPSRRGAAHRAAAVPAVEATNGASTAFPLREAQLTRLRQQYAHYA